MHNWNDSGMQWGWMMAMMAVVFVFGVATIAAVVAILRRTATPVDSTAQSASHATQILDERFARGELAEDEYRTRRAVLSEHTPPTSVTDGGAR